VIGELKSPIHTGARIGPWLSFAIDQQFSEHNARRYSLARRTHVMAGLSLVDLLTPLRCK